MEHGYGRYGYYSTEYTTWITADMHYTLTIDPGRSLLFGIRLLSNVTKLQSTCYN